MNAPELRLTFQADEDGWTGELFATVRSVAFSGKGSAWFDRESAKASFLVALRSFPFPVTAPPTIEGGFWSKEKSGNLDQCHLRIAIKPYDSRGTLLVHVDLATQSWKTPDVDLQNSASIRFLTEYAAIDAFAEHLEQVFDGKRDEAVLKGNVGP